MKESGLNDTFNPGTRAVQSFSASKEAITGALQEGKEAMNRLTRQSRHAVEDWMDGATHNIKRFPIGSVVTAFSVGALVGVLIARNGRR